MVVALLALSATEGRIDAAVIALLPVFVFWGLDGYFLWQERLYRALYDHARCLDDAEIDFLMDVAAFRTGRARPWLGATFSRTLLIFHGMLAVVVLTRMVVVLAVAAN